MDPQEMGALLRRLRTAAGLTQSELGERIGLRKDQISKVEHGIRRLDIAEMTLAAEALGTSARQLTGRSAPGTLALSARLATGASGRHVEAAMQRARRLLELDHLLGELGARVPPRTSPSADGILQWARALPGTASTTRASHDGRELAELTRAALGLGTAPIGNVADLAERQFGVDVECGPLGSGVSGMCVRSETIALILANTALTAGHLRFTVAHELGHHLLGDPREVVIEDGLGGDAPVERRANAFAAHLLMPSAEMRRVIDDRAISDEVLAELMQYFQVSLASLVNHLASCRIIEYSQRRELLERSARWLVHHHGDPGKADPTAEGQGSQPPVRLLNAARAAQRQGRIGGTIVAAILGVPIAEVSSALLPGESVSATVRAPESAADDERAAAEIAAAFTDL